MKTYPDTYLHVTECATGTEWIMPITGRMNLNLETRVRHWLKMEFSGEIALDGDIMPKLDGQFYAQIKTDGEPPESIRCWSGGGFYTKTTY